MTRPTRTKSQIGRQSARKGKDFERLVARTFNKELGTQFTRTKLGVEQPGGDLDLDVSKPLPFDNRRARRLERHFRFECKSNLNFSWDVVLGVMAVHPPLFDVFDIHQARAAENAKGFILVFRHKGTIYAMIRRREYESLEPRFLPEPRIEAGSRIICALESFFEPLRDD